MASKYICGSDFGADICFEAILYPGLYCGIKKTTSMEFTETEAFFLFD